MTRIVLFLTAVPLAAILALVLNKLLERAAEPREITKSLVFLAFVSSLLISPFATPAAASTEAPCHRIECSLEVDRQALDTLWQSSQPKKVKLLYQSRIPVTEEALRDSDSSLLVNGSGHHRPREGSPSPSSSAGLNTPHL